MLSLLHSIWGDSSPPENAPKISIRAIPSSDILHKYGSNEPFTITLEATLHSPSNKPLTVLIFENLLHPNSTPLPRGGMELINIETGEPAQGARITCVLYALRKGDIPIHRDYERYFLTLEPGVPYRVTETVRSCSRMSESVVGDFSHTSCLEVGARYRVELGEGMNEVTWYRYGAKEEGLDDFGGILGYFQRLVWGKKRTERVGDQKMEPIRLELQNEATFRVEE